MVFIHGISGQPSTQNNIVQSMSSNTDVKNVDDDDDDSRCCSRCGRGGKRRRGISCATLLFLLAIDAFTIALLLILFYNLKYIAGTYNCLLTCTNYCSNILDAGVCSW